MSSPTRPSCICVGGIVIDDIVFPDGQTRMGVLGGGVSHAAAGMALWSQRPGIVACAGYDLPVSARDRLARDFDTQGLIVIDHPQARAWQLFEWDGRRTEVFRVANFSHFVPSPDRVPLAYHGAKGVHLLRDAADLPVWRALFPRAVLFWEPFQQYMVAENAAGFRAALPQVDVVSPNLLEAQQVYGIDDPEALVRAMLDDGARVAVLRMGEQGSLAGERATGRMVRLPAVPVPEIVDQTGAGNTYCGAFLAGWVESGDLLTAARYGAVAASFALEVIGVADPPPDLETLRAQRWRCLNGYTHV